MTGGRLLIVEDDAELRSVLSRSLREEGFTVDSVATGGEVLARVDANAPDLFVIDIGLPDADGRDVCQALRARGIDAPVLFLTARDAVVDRVAGFDAGGDDYVAKPFALVELVARVQALLRRTGGTAALELEGIRLDPVSHSVSSADVEVALTPTEFRLLALLASEPGVVFSRRQLLERIRGSADYREPRTIDVHVRHLREKIERDSRDPELILTVRGAGYRFRDGA